MTPEERQLLTGLFDRMRPAANQPRDREAEALIAEQVRAQPYAAYLLSQTVIVQDQALQAANQKIQQLEAQTQQGQPPRQEEGGFLGGLGRMFGGQQNQPQGRGPVPNTGYGNQQGGAWGGQPQGAQGGPWGGQQQGGMMGGGMGGMMGGGGGGGFLKGALGAAAGVAGGVLLADGIRNLFTGGHNPLGIASGMEGLGGASNAGGETIVNNYYNDGNQQGSEPGNYGTQASDSGFDAGGGNDGGYDGGYSNDV